MSTKEALEKQLRAGQISLAEFTAINMTERVISALVELPDADMTVVKSTDEMRYTLGVMYVPGALDAHGEFVDDDSLHKSVIDYMMTSDRRLRLQHDPAVQVGTVVEMMRWPYEATIDLVQKDDGSGTSVTLPAGTVYMGVVWDEEHWAAVKSRKLNGFSLGGRAVRVKDAADAPTSIMNPGYKPAG